MAIALVISTSANADATSGSTYTSSAIDTTGANLLVLVGVHYDGGGDPTISDSKGNTWNALTEYFTTDPNCRIYYAVNPTVGSGHTFTMTNGTSASYGALAVLAFSGANTSSPYDVSNGNGATAGTSNQTGSITPSEDNEVIVSGLGINVSSAHAIDSGFTLQEDLVGSAFAYRVEAAYKIQTTAAAVNPTWSWTTSRVSSSAIACFKAAAGGAAGHPTARRFGLIDVNHGRARMTEIGREGAHFARKARRKSFSIPSRKAA